jgi:hypothetical protein
MTRVRLWDVHIPEQTLRAEATTSREADEYAGVMARKVITEVADTGLPME